jgi:hypothetical protein
MSANTLLVNGQIRPGLIPASVIPANPVFKSVAIAPNAGVPGVLSIENPAGDAFQIVKGLDGYTRMFQVPAGETANLSMLFSDDGNSAVISAQTIELGDATDATPTVNVIGSTGLGQVYDTRYNPAVKVANGPGPAPVEWTQNIENNGAGTNLVVDIDFTPTQTGYYSLVNTIAIISGTALNQQVDTAGIIEAYMSVSPSGGPTTVYVPGGNLIWNCSLAVLPSSISGAVSPLEWTQTCLFKLTAGTQYNIYIAGLRNATPSGVFDCACFGELVQMC